MTMTVTATQGGVTSNGIALRVEVLTGAKLATAPATASQTGAAAHQASITTTTAGSLVYGALVNANGNTSFTAAASTTLIDNIADATNACRYGSCKTTAVTGTPGPTTVGASAPSASGGAALLEILAAATIATDASGPAAASTLTAITVTSAAFSPPPGSLLVAMVMSDGGNGVTTMTVSGGGLIWTERIKGNGSQDGYAGVWTATVPLIANTHQPVTSRRQAPFSKGRAYQSTVTAAAPVPPVVTPAPLSNTAPARARILPPPRGYVYSRPGAPVHNPSSGPPVKPLAGPAQARRPLPPRGRVTGNAGAPVQNPPAAVVPRAAGYPVRSRIPQPFSKGRVYGNPGVRAVHAGPAVYPLQGPVRVRLPQLHPRAGRAYGSQGAPVHNPTSGPVFRQARQPVRAPVPPVFSKGRGYGSQGGPLPVTPAPQVPLAGPAGVLVTLVRTGNAQTSSAASLVRNPTAGPVFRLPATAAIARRLPARPGRTSGSRGAPVSNPVTGQGPPFYPLRQPARSRITPPPRGRSYGNPGAPVRNLAPPVTSAYRLATPVRARLPRPLTGRAITTHAVALQPPVYAQQVLTAPAGVLVYLLRTGHVQASVQTSPVRNPSSVPAPIYPLTGPVRARQPLPAPGRAATMASLPAPVPPPITIAPPAPLTSPARSRILPPPRGRVSGNQGAPVNNPVLTSGPPFPPLTSPAGLRVIFSRIGSGAGSPGAPAFSPAPPAPGRLSSPVRARQPLPLRGRVSGNRGGPVQNPVVTPAKFYPPVQAVRARPGTFSKGRTEGNAGAPVHNPVTGTGPPFYPQGTVRYRITLPPRGRAYGGKGAPVTHAGPPVTPLQGPSRARLPQLHPRAGRVYGNPGTPPVHAGPVFRQATSPARAPVPPVFSKGRTAANPGAPVHNPPVPFPPLAAPVRARQLPQRGGRAYGNAGAPVRNPVTLPVPLVKALHAQPAVFLKGRASGNAGAPVNNPTSGPVFRQATSPARYRIVLPPRGRVYGNIGAPISNPVEGPVPPGTLYLTPGTITQGRPYAATTIGTPAGVLTITSATTADVYTATYTAVYGSSASGATVTISPAAEGFAPSSLTPPPDSDIPPPDPVVVPAYVQS